MISRNPPLPPHNTNRVDRVTPHAVSDDLFTSGEDKAQRRLDFNQIVLNSAQEYFEYKSILDDIRRDGFKMAKWPCDYEGLASATTATRRGSFCSGSARSPMKSRQLEQGKLRRSVHVETISSTALVSCDVTKMDDMLFLEKEHPPKRSPDTPTLHRITPADMNNLDKTIQVNPIPTTRIHKDHPLDQVIRDLQSATQTRHTSKNLEENGFEEPKKVIHALKDPSWIEAMQEELHYFQVTEGIIQGWTKSMYRIHQVLEIVYESFVKNISVRTHGFQRGKNDKTVRITEIAYEHTSDSDYAGASLDKKSTTGGCQFLGCRLISWQFALPKALDLEQQLDDMSTHKRIYFASSHTKKIFGNMRRVGKGFSGRVTLLFPTMVVQNQQEMGEGSAMPIDPQHTPTFIQPSTSQPQKTQKPRKPKRKDTQVVVPSAKKPLGDTISQTRFENVSTQSLNPMLAKVTSLQNGVEDSLTKTTQDDEIVSLKRKGLRAFTEKMRSQESLMGKSTHKVGMSRKVESSKDEEGLGEDASKQGRINAVDADDEITLVSVQDDADAEMFDVGTLTGDEVLVEQEVAAKCVNLTIDEVTLAQVLAALKSVKPKVLFSLPARTYPTTPATILTPRKGIVITELGTPTITRSSQQPSQAKIALKLQADIDEEERIARAEEEKIDEANIAWVGTFKQKKTTRLSSKRADKRKKAWKGREGEDGTKPPTKNSTKKDCLTYLKKHERVNMFMDFRAGEELENEEEVVIDVVPLATKSPKIVDWKIHKEGKKSYYQIIRFDEKSQMCRIFSQMIKSFNREDLEDLYKLVKARYGSTRQVEDLDLVLWNDLKTMFEPHFAIWNDLHAGRKEISPYTTYNYRYVEPKASVNATEGVNAASEEVSTAELVSIAIIGLIMNGLTSDFAGFVRNYNMHNMGKTIGELHAMLIEYKKGLPKKAATPQVMTIQGGRIQKANKKSLNAKGKGKGKGKGKDKPVCIPKPENPKPFAKEHPAKDDAYHHCKEVYDTGCGTHTCNTKQGLRGARKLKQGAFYLYVGHGVRAQVEAIGSYD
ncbi:hypothetical protein Tco_0241289 [Tanacetum coccineum]